MKTDPIQPRVGIVVRKSFFVCLFIVLAIGSAIGQNWETGSLEEAQAKARVSGKLLLLDFFQEYG
jgi:hypothetical protein